MDTSAENAKIGVISPFESKKVLPKPKSITDVTQLNLGYLTGATMAESVEMNKSGVSDRPENSRKFTIDVINRTDTNFPKNRNLNQSLEPDNFLTKSSLTIPKRPEHATLCMNQSTWVKPSLKSKTSPRGQHGTVKILTPDKGQRFKPNDTFGYIESPAPTPRIGMFKPIGKNSSMPV
jgi:hypothetical protein